MSRDALRSLAVLVGIALVCSILVSVSTSTLRPIKERNEALQRYRNVVALTGLVGPNADDDAVFEVVEKLDARVVDLETGAFAPDVDPDTVDARAAASDPERSAAIPTDADTARLGRRANHAVVYLLWDDEELSRVIFPISGQGMWSTLFGFIALEGDLNTIAAVTFYEQAETAGLGDQIEDPVWQAKWQGRQMFGDSEEVRFQVATGAASSDSLHEVDGLTGATLTGGSVTNLIQFWFGPAGFGPFLKTLEEEPPVR